MKAKTSLRTRFLLGVAVVTVLALVGTGLTLLELFRQEIARQIETRLATHLDQLALVVELIDGKPVLSSPLLEPRFNRPYSGLYWQIDGAAGAALRSRSLWDTTLKLPETTQHLTVGPGGDPVFVLKQHLLLEDQDTPWTLAVAINRAEIDGPVANFRWLIGGAFGGLILVLLAGSAIAVWLAMRPLQGLRGGLARVHARETDRLDGAFPSELQPVVDDLNDLLADRELSIARARTQAGNLAHALKTPLSIITNEAAAAGRTGDATRAETLRDAAGSMERHIHHHLARSRASAAARDVTQGADTRPVIEKLAQAMRVLRQDREVAFEIDITDGGPLKIDPEDLTEVLGNLIDNAFIWARTEVHASGGEAGDNFTIAIEDDGPGLTPAQIQQALVRGARLDDSQPGSGLGLSIVTDLVELFGGTFSLGASDLGGTRAQVTLPLLNPTNRRS